MQIFKFSAYILNTNLLPSAVGIQLMLDFGFTLDVIGNKHCQLDIILQAIFRLIRCVLAPFVWSTTYDLVPVQRLQKVCYNKFHGESFGMPIRRTALHPTSIAYNTSNACPSQSPICLSVCHLPEG